MARGRVEERVGVILEKLRERGFSLLHDLPLMGVGNVDHVVLGEREFYAIETKSHREWITTREGELLTNGRPP